MERKSRDNPAIRQFIIRHLTDHPNDIASYTSRRFNISRMTTNRYLDKLVNDGLVKEEGETKARKYTLIDYVDEVFPIQITPETQEDVIWRERVRPLLKDLPAHVLTILEYGVQEIVNNVIDHSESSDCVIGVEQNADRVRVTIRDHGVGIFDKIAKAEGLTDKREAILELAKGKLTTDPERHTGEGIFFTSRATNKFSILSDDLTYIHDKANGDRDWLIEDAKPDQAITGTCVILIMYKDEKETLEQVFAKYSTDNDGVGIFSKTHVPIALARYPNEQLVSRSQARRVLSRFNKFSEVILDFADVLTIGQAFADEIFRVFKNAHPEIILIPLRTSPQVKAMIDRAIRGQTPGTEKEPIIT
jgi:anti-sigma regulatory factor (Ser/Thr protein kinase)/predicted transcriptional regulator